MSTLEARTSIGKAWRFIVVGLSVNAGLYVIYLALAAAGLSPQLAMTVAYVTGVATSYVFNHRWSFRSRRDHGSAVVRYFALYGAVYLGQLGALTGLIALGLHHAIAQLLVMGCAAVILFLCLDRFVFHATAAERPSQKLP